jgi:cell division protein FtsB
MPKFSIDWRRVAILVGVAFLVVILIDFNARLEELDKLNKQVEIVRAEATQVAQTQMALETKVEYATSDQASEDYARGEGHMKQEGDFVMVIIGSDDAPTLETAEPAQSPTPKPNWQLWWDLFFSEE